MASIIPIDATGDLIVANRRIAPLEKRPGYVLAQRIFTRIFLPRTTWYQNLDAGFPWDLVLGLKVSGATDMRIIRTIFVTYFNTIPGLKELRSLTVTPPTPERELDVDFVAIADDGATVAGLSPITVDGVPAFPEPFGVTFPAGTIEMGE